MSLKPTPWKRTGDCRIVPWWFGLMRAEFMERRECGGIDEEGGRTMFQTRWVSAGRFPWEMDITSPFGFWSTMSTPVGDTKKFGDRALWRGFITYFKGNDVGPKTHRPRPGTAARDAGRLPGIRG